MDVSISSLLQSNQPKKTLNDFDYANSSLTQNLHAINLESRDIFGSFRFCADIARITSNSTACPVSSSRQSNLMNSKTEKRRKTTSNVEGVEKMRSILKIVYLEMKLGIFVQLFLLLLFLSLLLQLSLAGDNFQTRHTVASGARNIIKFYKFAALSLAILIRRSNIRYMKNSTLFRCSG